ncbi:hypothetical protein QCA50_006429 [Cerrena zonata]|uniref:Epoxide hydrolase N-terminal domain-containing protein n=1 Tax=Cerrena zonata TaxID=2478898 RepID=A0AAW0G8Q2_9APHY
MSETPFKLSIPDADIELLRKKLQVTRLPDELDDAKWDYGAPLADIKRLAARWENGYDWRKYEAEVNKIPQFTRDIEVEGFGSLNIHYVHQKSKLGNAIPLLYVHGWPGLFTEISKLLPLLTAVAPDQPSFHVVTYSLPGYGFSEGCKKKGFAIKQYAEVGHKLMLALGYKEYVTEGGDWGSIITHKISALYGGKYAKAWHTTCPPSRGPPTFWSAPGLFLRNLITPITEFERKGLARRQDFLTKGNAYFLEQASKPQTLGYSLTDSPVGMLAWIYEKLIAWTDDYPWTDDEMLNWISTYWFSRSGPAASIRIYYEYAHSAPTTQYIEIPSGISLFPKELLLTPTLWVKVTTNVQVAFEHDKGGHYPAYEVPKVLADDLRKMFGIGGVAFGVVPGRSGYAIA